MAKLQIFLLLSCLVVGALSANILFLSSVASPSHFIWCSSLLNDLAAKGHNITALSPDVEKSDKITYLLLEEVYPEIYNGPEEVDYFEMGKVSTIQLLSIFSVFGEDCCKGALKSKGYQQLLDYPNDFKFDLVISDTTMGPCLLSFVDKFGNPPLVSVTAYNGISSSSMFTGGLSHPAFVPALANLFPNEMTFFQRLFNLVMNAYEFLLVKHYYIPRMDNLVRKRQPHNKFGNLADTFQGAKVFLVNVNPLMDYKEPLFSNIKLVGGLQIKKAKALPEDLKLIADKATNGVVLFSLGTNVRSDMLGRERIERIIKALGRLPKYTFLWKFETTESLPANMPSNVHIRKWMPQNDILAHPNTKLFISHCGLLSSQEAVWFGVPVLGFPVFADQPQNSLRLKNLGVGETLSIKDFTENELSETIKKMLENPKYQKNIGVLSAAFKDQQNSPLETATFWVEWVLRHPDIDTKSPSVNMGFMTRNSFDLVAFLTAITLVILYVFSRVICKLMTCFKKQKVDMNGKFKKTN